VRIVILTAVLVLATSSVVAAAAPVPIDDFDDVAAWSPQPASGVELTLAADHGAMRLDFDFRKGGGYAVARRAVDLALPANYAFTFRLKGKAPVNHLEFKLVDASGENVWWHVKRDLAWPADWQPVRIRKRQIAYAWGPLGGGTLRRVAAVEIVVTAGTGGAGTVWVDDLELVTLPPPGAAPPAPRATASFAAAGQGPERAVDGDSATTWVSAARDRRPWIALDLGLAREFGGLLIDWAPGRHAGSYIVDASDDGRTWRTLREVMGSNGGRDALFLPESEARHLRLRVTYAAGVVALREITLGPIEWASRADFFKALAALQPPAVTAPGMGREQTYWTVVGVDGSREEGLIGEDGTVEVGPGAFSIEPFLAGSSQARREHGLVRGDLPIPWVRTTDVLGARPANDVLATSRSLALGVTAVAVGPPDSSAIVARYRISNLRDESVATTLFLALRPFQVNPVQQFLNVTGGPARIRSIAFDGRRAIVNDEREVVSLSPPSRAGASAWDGGEIAEHLHARKLPAARRVEDPFEAASGAFAYDLRLGPREEREIVLLIPLGTGLGRAAGDRLPASAAAPAWAAERQAEAEAAWERRLGTVRIAVPDTAIVHTLRAQLGWILVDRAGPALQPGTRAYARSWIRDGALTSTALLRLGQDDVVRDFIEWFAPYQYDDGKVPCCVDRRGSDPVPEHDSHGEFIYLVAEYFRHTGDRALVERMWPRVAAAAGYQDSLRKTRRTAEYEAASKREFYGLLPPSISHEGYSAKPMHSYWDDFFALRGFRDAAFLAGALGRDDERRRWSAVADEFASDFGASIRAAMARHKIDYIPGCADLGDFDATSTTIALAPVGAEAILPEGALPRTFEKWLEFHRERITKNDWDALTPYELRIVGSLVRLGRRKEALGFLKWMMGLQRPAGWVQWAEVVGREERKPRFLGDMPHGWVASDGIRSILDLLAYERDSDSTLVLVAGVPAEWLWQGVGVHGLSTHYGALTYQVRQREGAIEVRIEALDRTPRGGVVLRLPLEAGLRFAKIDGEPAWIGNDGAMTVRRLPATVRLTQGAGR